MNVWLELSHVPVIILAALVFFAVALFAYDGLRFLVRDIRSWLTKTSRNPEEKAVDEMARYQGSFHLGKPGPVRQRFAHRLQIQLKSHWGCEAKWTPDD